MLTTSGDAGCRCGTSCRIDTTNLSRFAKSKSYIDIYGDIFLTGYPAVPASGTLVPAAGPQASTRMSTFR